MYCNKEQAFSAINESLIILYSFLYFMWSKIITGILLLCVITVLALILKPEPPLLPPAGQVPSATPSEITYRNKEAQYSITHPKDWSIEETYTYQLRGPDLPAPTGVKFFVPKALASSTNLSADSGLSIETASSSVSCSALDFLSQSAYITTKTIDGIQYSIATTTDAGAGNYYEEHVFAIASSTPCFAVRYFIHSTNIENYDPGTIKEFNYTSLIKEFDTMRDSLQSL
jgi:hypothetical protein